jgi:hypothetical protein
MQPAPELQQPNANRQPEGARWGQVHEALDCTLKCHSLVKSGCHRLLQYLPMQPRAHSQGAEGDTALVFVSNPRVTVKATLRHSSTGYWELTGVELEPDQQDLRHDQPHCLEALAEKHEYYSCH